jgi:hypothetical protein
VGAGRRQLQAHVRLRTTGHSSGPSSPGAQRGTRLSLPCPGVVMPGWTDARILPQRRPPHATGLSFGERRRSERTGPTDADIVEGAGQGCVHNRIVLWRTAQPNESRLSCGALKKDSFHNLRAPSASSAS